MEAIGVILGRVEDHVQELLEDPGVAVEDDCECQLRGVCQRDANVGSIIGGVSCSPRGCLFC